MRPVHGGCWWALAVAVVVPVLWAAPATAETTVEVDAGYAGWFVPGQQVPVRVRVVADRLVRGSLEVAVGTADNAVPVAMAIEVPGASQKEFLLTAAAGLNQNPNVTATLRQDGRQVAFGQASVRSVVETELVGVLAGALRGRTLPGTTPLAVDAGTARFVAVGEAELEQAPASLGPLSTLVADTDELGRLAPDARSGVLRWLEAGGRLLVDAAKGQPVPGLPDAWQPGSRGRAAAGLGEVVATDGAIAAGRWTGLVEPSSWGSGAARLHQADVSLAGSLAADAGLRTPELGWLVGFLALYVVVVGPVLFLVLRRRGRTELAWVAIPLVAVLFSTGSYVVGRDLRHATQLVHASVVSPGLTGSTATTYVGLFSRGGETVRVGFPAAWSSGPFGDLDQSAAGPSLITRTPAGPEVRLPLDAGQFGMVNATGPVAEAGGLEVTATAGAGGLVSGTVRNPTPFRLDEAAVFLGGGATVLGTLGPGEQRPFTVTGGGQLGKPGAETWIWGNFGRDVDGAADAGLWQVALRAAGANFMGPGAVVAAGWTREFTPEVRVDGRTRKPQGRTVVLGRQQVAGGAGTAVRRDVVRDPFSDSLGGGRGAGAVVRFVLPDGIDTAKLVLTNPYGRAELWRDGSWQTAACATVGCANLDVRVGQGPGGIAISCAPGPCELPPQLVQVGGEFAVPPAAVRDGVVWVRVPGPASSDPGGSLTIVERP